MAGKIIQLDDTLFIGKGLHKKCYRHPENGALCIKFAYNELGSRDLARELKYLAIIKNRKKDYSVLAKYYGPVSTNYGTGYLYEHILDYDGKECKTLEDYLKDDELLKENLPVLIREMRKLKDILIENEIITMGISTINILIQRTDATDGGYRVRVINDMGSAVVIPLEYYSSYLAKAKIRRHWKRFMDYILGISSTPAAHALVDAIK